MKRLFLAAAVGSAALALSACDGKSIGSPDSTQGGGNSSSKYHADIRWTQFGIPHIKAQNWSSLGYGVGYAFASDNICTLADDIVTIDGERSKYFGPNGSHSIISAFNASNLESDFAFKLLVTPEKVADFASKQTERSADLATGYADGYNRYLNELKDGEHPGRHEECRDEPWLRELSRDDMYRRYIRLAMLASSTVFRDGIANAAPNADTSGGTAQLSVVNNLPIGSNMYGIGTAGTQDGSTMLLGNPHFPWYGPERLHAFHVTIPGVIDSLGSGLHGTPVPLIAFNDRFAWSHTVSAAYRFTLYEITLVPGNPYQYVYGTETKSMVPHEITVELDDGGSETRTLYTTIYGPMAIVNDPALAWNTATNKAYAVADANYDNDRLIEQFISWHTAKDLAEFRKLHGEVLGIPWVNTVAVGPDSSAYYGDVTVVPNVPTQMLETAANGGDGCAAPGTHDAVQALVPGLPVLDGSNPDCGWRVDADSPQEGIFGPGNLPTLLRDDWVHNCNDSYWLTNPAQPLPEFARIIGDHDAERSLRTRLCIIQVQQRLAAEDGISNTPKFTLEQFQDVSLRSRVYTAEIERDNVISGICGQATGGIINASYGSPINVQEACGVLQAWDMKTDTESVGAHIWREFWTRADNAQQVWVNAYSSDDPVNTPNTLNTTAPDVKMALADAVQAIENAGIAMTARFGSVQYDTKNGEEIEMYGGLGSVGNFTITIPSNGTINEDGYPLVEYGNSWVYTVQYKDDKVQANGYVTYSQSTDPASPHYSDYTKAYANKEWPLLPYYEEDIERMKIREMTVSE